VERAGVHWVVVRLVHESRLRHGRRRSCLLRLVFLATVFFQAEDGIRDATVTGVQTCALPIYASNGGQHFVAADAFAVHVAETEQIGRASCRERVEGPVVAAYLQTTRSAGTTPGRGNEWSAPVSDCVQIATGRERTSRDREAGD